jgi:hypothetical protein
MLLTLGTKHEKGGNMPTLLLPNPLHYKASAATTLHQLHP